MALLRGSNLRLAHEVSDADIMDLLQESQQQELPAATQTTETAPVASSATFNPVGFDWANQGVQRIGGLMYQPIFDDFGNLQEVLRFQEGQTGAGQSYERLDPTTLQPTGTGKFQEVGGVLDLLQTAAQDLGPLALAAMGVNPGLAAGLGGAAASALGIPVASTAGAAGLTAGQVAALGSGLASTGIGLAQGQNPLEAIKTGLLTGATAMVPSLASELVPSTGNVAVDSALKSAVASGTKAALSGQSVEEAVLGALTVSGLGSATGIDPKVIGNAVKVITSGGDPKQIFNTVVSAVQTGTTGAAAPATQTSAATSSQLASETERLQELASTATPFPDQSVTSESLGQALVDLQQGAGDQLAFAGAIPGLVGAASETAAAAAARAAITRALQSSAQTAVPAIQQAAAASPAVAQALASPAVQRVLAGLASAGIATGPLLGFVAQPTDTGDETARLAARFPSTTPATAVTTATAPTSLPVATQTSPVTSPITQLAQQTTGTPYDVTGDPYVGQGLETQVAPATVDAQRLARVLNTDINTANALISANPELFGGLIGGATTGSTPTNFELMRDVDIRNLLAERAAGTAAQAGGTDFNVIGRDSTTQPATQVATPATAGTQAATPNVYPGYIDPILLQLFPELARTTRTTPTTAPAVAPTPTPTVAPFPPVVEQQVEVAAPAPAFAIEEQVQQAVAPMEQPVEVSAASQPITDQEILNLIQSEPSLLPVETPAAVPTEVPAQVAQQVETQQEQQTTQSLPETQTRVDTQTQTETSPVYEQPPSVPDAVATEPVSQEPALVAPTPIQETPIEQLVIPTEPTDLGAVEPQENIPVTPTVVEPEPTPAPVTEEPAPTPAPAPPPPSTTYLFTPSQKQSPLLQALSVSPSASPGRVGLAYSRPAGEIEAEVTGKKRRNVWNEASLRLRDALGL